MLKEIQEAIKATGEPPGDLEDLELDDKEIKKISVEIKKELGKFNS